MSKFAVNSLYRYFSKLIVHYASLNTHIFGIQMIMQINVYVYAWAYMQNLGLSLAVGATTELIN